MKFLFSILLLTPFFLVSHLPDKKEFKTDTLYVSVSVYNPHISQCDSDPLETASQLLIDTNLLKQNKLKWCAVSRNLLKRFNPKAKYNLLDTITLDHNLFKGKYIITDVTKDIYYNRVDVLHHNLKYCHKKGKILL
jgi:hypothetical protein